MQSHQSPQSQQHQRCYSKSMHLTKGSAKLASFTLFINIIIQTFLYIPGILCIQASKSASLGGQQILDCSLHYPNNKPTLYLIEWNKNGLDEPVVSKYGSFPPQYNEEYRNRVRLVNGISLEISHIQEYDQGWYECKVIFADGFNDESNNGTWVHLNVNIPPKIVSSSPLDLHRPLGSTVKMYCKASGSPRPNVTWTKNGKPVMPSRRLSIESEGRDGRDLITITNLQENDGGIFKCTFQNAVGMIAQTIHLIVEGQAYIINPPSNKTAVLGQRISFTCEARGYPNNITYRWYKDDINVNNLASYGTRIKIHDNDGSLIFAIVEKEDMGWYRCEPSNGYGENPRASAFLNVTYAPEVLVDRMPSTVIWAMGLNESIDCPVDANPPVNNIVWTNNGAVLDMRNRRLQLLENGSLLVRFVQLSDSGNYRCSAFSSFGNMDSKIVQVEVKDPPRFTVRPNRQYIRQPAQTVTMSCAAAGTPFPTIMWRRAVGSLVVGGRIQQLDGNLTIYGLQKSDHGVYECEARNEVRKIVTSTELIIQNTTPHAPYNISVETTQFTATIRWIPAYSSTPQHFVVWYRAIINGSPQQYTTMRVEPQNATRFTLYMLEPNTLYEFKVLSRNELGAGQYSDPIRERTLGYTVGIDDELPKFPNGSTYLPPIRTPDGPMPSSPVNVSAVLHDKSVTIFWAPPRNTPVKIYAYVVEYRIDGGIWQKTEPLLQQTSVELTELEYGRHYSFRVFSRSVLSYSRPSDEVAVSVPQEKESGLSHTEIGGIIGGLLFLIVAVVLAVVAVICNRQRGQQRRETKYGNVKYLGPQDEIDSRPEYPPEWSDVTQNGRGNIVGERQGRDNQVFVLPQSADMYKGYNRDGVAHPRLRKPPPPYGSDGGRQVQTSVNYSRNVSDYPDTSMQNYSSQSFDRHSAKTPRDNDDDDNGFLDRSGSRRSPNRYRSRSQPTARHSMGPGYPAPERPRSRGHSYHSDSQSHPDVSFLDNTVRYQPQSFQSRPRSRSPHHPTSQIPTTSPNRQGQGHNRSYPSYHGNMEDEEDEEVFMPPPISSVLPGKPGFPRHSSMKPSAQQTYLTDDLDHSSHPFLTNNISSVLPSPFSDSHTKLPYRPYQRQYPSSSDQRVPYGSPSVLRDSSHEPSYTDMDNTVVARQPSPNKSMSRTLSGDRSSSDSSGRPMNYTRDQLLGVVDKVRKGPRAARKGNVPGPRTSGSSSFDSFERPSIGGRHGAQIPESVKPPSVIVRDRPSRGYPQDMGDSRTSMNSSSGLGSALGRNRDPRSYPRDDLTPDSLSSGIGSRNTSSQLTGSSLHSRPSRLGSNLTSHDHDLSTDSAQPYLDYPPPHRKDISGDENYEFDSYNAVESDLLEALRNYSEVNSGNDELLNALQDGLNTTGLLHELYPKPTKQSRYSDSEKRFEKLRGEYQKYRQEQQERRGSGLDSNNRSSTYSSNGSGYGSSFVPYAQNGNSSNVSKNYGYPGETNQYFAGRGDNSNYKAGPMDSDML